MVISCPLPGGYNVAFGEPTLPLSMLFLPAAMTLALEWEPLVPAIYGFCAAIYAVVIGIAIYDLHLTVDLLAALAGYLLNGIGGMLVLPATMTTSRRLGLGPSRRHAGARAIPYKARVGIIRTGHVVRAAT